MGMSNGIGTIAGLLCPIAIDYLTSDQVRKTQRKTSLSPFPQHLPKTMLSIRHYSHPLN